jgi:hypothetical protein
MSDAATGRIRARSDVRLQRVGREAILHDPLTRQAHVINAAAAQVWDLCDGRDLASLATSFGAPYGRTGDQVRPDVETVLDGFGRLGLLETDAGP